MKTFHFILASLLVCTATSAQTKIERKYEERAKEVEMEVMSTPDPLFASNTVPELFSKSSAVIIAKKVEVAADLKTKVKHSFFYGKDVQHIVRYTLTIREKIKLLDKSALNDYSELSFSKIRKQSSFFKGSAFSFLGIRLIKADGTVQKINVDEEAVNAESEDEREKYKLAMPGLEVGDIIDMYARVEQESRDDNPIEPLDIVLGGEYPMVKYSFSTKVSDEFGIMYTLSNNTPNIQRSSENGYMNLSLDMDNIKKTPEMPWVYERRELPVIKINIVPGPDPAADGRFKIKKGQILQELPKSWVDNYVAKRISGLRWEKPSPNFKLFKEYIKKISNGKEFSLSEDSMIHHIYYFGRYLNLYDNIAIDRIEAGTDRNASSSGFGFFEFVLEAFNAYAIEYDFMYTVSRGTGTIYSVLSPKELIPVIRAVVDRSRYYYLAPPDMFSIVNSFSPVFEAQEAYVFKNVKFILPHEKSDIQKLPATKSSFNFLGEDLEISINAEKPQQLDVRRIRTLRGNPAYQDQVMLLLFEDYVNAERAKFGGGSFEELLMDRAGKKKGSQLVQEYKQAFAEARKKRIEYAQKELESTFETKAIILDSFNVLKTGNRHDQTDFVFREKFSMDGILKKAGPNFILDISSLIAGQMQIKPEQRTRDFNIHMPYARSYEYKISLIIPNGFSVQGLENLQKNVSNETGSFISTAVVENGKLIIKANKVYNHNYETAAKWDSMVQFLDAGYNFSQEKVLIKKN